MIAFTSSRLHCDVLNWPMGRVSDVARDLLAGEETMRREFETARNRP